MIRLISTRKFGDEMLRETWLVNPANIAAIRLGSDGSAVVHLAAPLREIAVTDPNSVARLAALEAPSRRSSCRAAPAEDGDLVDLSESY